MFNSEHDGAFSIRDFALMMAQILKSNFGPMSFEVCGL
jgi:hypothetical protein